jgi:hypothetical protein
MISRYLLLPLAIALPLHGPPFAQAEVPGAAEARDAYTCPTVALSELRRNPTERELRCRFGAHGPGRFGLLSYVDLPVYQPATPMPGTHLVGVPGHAAPRPGESFEEWEWRVHRTAYGPEAHDVHRGLETLDPVVAARIMTLERRLAAEGIRAVRRETWRSPVRQAYLFQQGRSRPGPLATTTLTSWHSQVDQRGQPAGRAVDYTVAAAAMPRFHEIVAEVGLESFGYDSHDPGHVFLPKEDEVHMNYVILLRTLPRVPEVTLGTGLPVDRGLPEGGSEALRASAMSFAEAAFVSFPEARLAREIQLPVLVSYVEVRRPERLAAAEGIRIPARPRFLRAAGGDVRGELRRSEHPGR